MLHGHKHRPHPPLIKNATWTQTPPNPPLLPPWYKDTGEGLEIYNQELPSPLPNITLAAPLPFPLTSWEGRQRRVTSKQCKGTCTGDKRKFDKKAFT